MKVIESAAAGVRVDGYFAEDWAQPRPHRRAERRASAAVADQRRLSREFKRARALAAASPRPERRAQSRRLDGGMGSIFRGIKFNFNALAPDLALNKKIAENILEASGFLRRETVPSV